MYSAAADALLKAPIEPLPVEANTKALAVTM
jgi:hypothetical protein